MAYSGDNLTAAESAGFTADKPMMVVQQINEAASVTSRWGTTGIHNSGSDNTAAATPASRAHDELGSIVTASASIKTTTPRYYNLYLSGSITFDTLLITSHNFASTGVTSVSLEISNASDYGSSGGDLTVEIGKWERGSATADDRILITNLNNEGGSSDAYSSSGTAQRYSSVVYARLKIVGAGSSENQMGELWLGHRYQLQRNPDIPWNNKNEASLAADYVSNSGITKRYTFYRGQALRTFQASIAAAAEITVIDGWFNAINEGTRPFVYIETPSSSAQAIVVILDDAGLSFPLVGPTERRLAFSMTEQPPFLSRE